MKSVILFSIAVIFFDMLAHFNNIIFIYSNIPSIKQCVNILS